MLLIGAAGRDAGKTTFACEVIQRFEQAQPVAAKVTAIQERDGACPRGGEGCGVCSSLTENYCITEETRTDGEKDTQRLLAAGAQRVYWLRVLKEHLEEGAGRLLDLLGTDVPIICESNSLRLVVEPGLFIMMRRHSTNAVKASAQSVLHHANAVVYSDGTNFDLHIEHIKFENYRWMLNSM
jgi:hypothetical protein